MAIVTDYPQRTAVVLSDFAQELISLGRHDAEQRASDVIAFFAA